MLYSLNPYKLTLPVDARGLFGNTAAEVRQPLLKTYTGPWFKQSDEGYVFLCPDGGAVTATASKPRCELRNMTEFSYLSTVVDTPYIFAVNDLQVGQSVIVGQIHDKEEPWFMLTYQRKEPGDELWAMFHAKDGAPHSHKLLKKGLHLGDKTKVKIRFVSAIPLLRKQRIEVWINDVKTNIPMGRTGKGGKAYFKRGNYYQNTDRKGAICVVTHYPS